MKNRKGILKSGCVDPLGLTYETRGNPTVYMKRSPPLVMQGMGAMLMEGTSAVYSRYNQGSKAAPQNKTDENVEGRDERETFFQTNPSTDEGSPGFTLWSSQGNEFYRNSATNGKNRTRRFPLRPQGSRIRYPGVQLWQRQSNGPTRAACVPAMDRRKVASPRFLPPI